MDFTYPLSFALTGTIERVTIELKPKPTGTQASASSQKAMVYAARVARRVGEAGAPSPLIYLRSSLRPVSVISGRCGPPR